VLYRCGRNKPVNLLGGLSERRRKGTHVPFRICRVLSAWASILYNTVILVGRVLVAEGDVEIRYVVPSHPNSEKVRFCHLRKDYFNHVIEILALA
jgi:hypothetical protein